jgi:hypothetical protein
VLANFAANLLVQSGGTRRTVLSAVKTTLAWLSTPSEANKAIQAGMRKLRPDKVRHDNFYSLHPLWVRMLQRPWAALNLEERRTRLLVALTLDTLSRSQCVANLYVENVQMGQTTPAGDSGMYVRFALPKHGGVLTPRVWVQRFSRSSELCSVWMMEQWLLDTAQLRWPSVRMDVGGIARTFTPVFFNLAEDRRGHSLSPDTIANAKKRFLGDAGINTSLFTGHSLRGAAVTAALLAGDGTDIWKEMLRCTGRWKDLACMMKHYCLPVGVLPHRSPPFPTGTAEAVRWSLRTTDLPRGAYA